MIFDELERTLKLNYVTFDVFNVDGKEYTSYSDFVNNVQKSYLLNVKAILKKDDKVEIHFTTKKLYDFKVVHDDMETLEIDFMFENRKCTIKIFNVEDEDGNYTEFNYEDRIYDYDYELYFRVRDVFKDCDKYIEFNNEHYIPYDIDYIDDETIKEIESEIIEYIKTR